MANTVNRSYSIPSTGAEVGVWGSNDLNPNFALIDNNLGGVATIALTNANHTLSSAEYACGTIRLTGILTGNCNVVFPLISAWFTIDNQTTGAFVATLTMGSGQVIAVEQGTAADILLDGVNIKFRNLPPVGTYLDVCDGTVPAWITACTVPPYLNCDGSAFSSVTYPYLYAKLGSTTLPDTKGRGRIALNQGSGRVTTAGSNLDGNTRFAGGGNQNVTLVANQLPANIPNSAVSSSSTSVSFNYGFYAGTSSSQTQAAPTVSGYYVGYGPLYGITASASTSTTTTVTINAGGGSSTPLVQPSLVSGLMLIRSA